MCDSSAKYLQYSSIDRTCVYSHQRMFFAFFAYASKWCICTAFDYYSKRNSWLNSSRRQCLLPPSSATAQPMGNYSFMIILFSVLFIHRHQFTCTFFFFFFLSIFLYLLFCSPICHNNFNASNAFQLRTGFLGFFINKWCDTTIERRRGRGRKQQLTHNM